jgi:hypothetical protein
MTVRKAQASLGQGVQIRSSDLALRVIGPEVTEALVIGQDDDDVRSVRGDETKTGEEEKQGQSHEVKMPRGPTRAIKTKT